jgi:hypothetical protein
MDDQASAGRVVIVGGGFAGLALHGQQGQAVAGRDVRRERAYTTRQVGIMRDVYDAPGGALAAQGFGRPSPPDQ